MTHQRQRDLIIGGHDVERGRYPFFVSIDKNNGVIVSGALIAPDIVLSAGHIALNHMDNITLVVSAWSVHDDPQTKEVIPIEQWILHPEWSQFSPTEEVSYFSHDFLIFTLAGKSSQKPITINRSPEIPTTGEDVVIMGLGWTQELVLSPATVVQETTLTVLTNEACAAANDPSRNLTYQGMIVPTMMCTHAPPNTTRDGCAWDSGDPVILRGDTADNDLLVGLGSTGIGCADKTFPGIQSRVSADLDWITSQVCALSSDPPIDFNCGNKTTSTTLPTTSTVLLAAAAPDGNLFELEGGPYLTNALLVASAVVLFGAVAMLRRGGVLRARRTSNYSSL